MLPGNGSQFDVQSKMMSHPLNISNPLNGIEAKSLSTVLDRVDIMSDYNTRTVPSNSNLLPSNPMNLSSTAGDNTMTTKIMEENQSLLVQQLKKMEGFEMQQQEQFRKDLEEQRRMLEFKQKDYKDAMEQQRNMTQEQILAMQQRQTAVLRQQQMQAETMLKQMQSQMESEMRMKSELLRNQLNIFSEIQAQNPMQPIDINTVMQQLQSNSENGVKGPISKHENSKESVEELRKHYEMKCERLNEIHAEETKDLKECNNRLKERLAANKEEYQKDLESERERRLTDLARLRDEHSKMLGEVKEEHSRALEQVLYPHTHF